MSAIPSLIVSVASGVVGVAGPFGLGGPVLSWANKFGIVAHIVVVVLLVWTLCLHRVVRSRRAELEGKNQELERESAERREALEALQLSDKRLGMAMQAAQLRTWHWDVTSDRFELVGDRTAEMGPPPPTSGDGLERFLRAIHPDDIGPVRAAIRQTRDTGETLGVDFRVVVPDGSVRWKVGRGCAIRDASGQITSLVGVVLDVTDRVRSDDVMYRN
jgi:PAS domain-containing protein